MVIFKLSLKILIDFLHNHFAVIKIKDFYNFQK